MNLHQLKQNLDPPTQARWDLAIENENFAQAASILTQAGFVDDAIALCMAHDLMDIAVDIAAKSDRLDCAENLCRQSNNLPKLAELLTLKAEYSKAADIYVQLKQYEKAAKLLFNCKKYEEAANLYTKIKQYMNAVMCYQKSGNIPKQLEMQIKAFENDLALANGDLMSTNVSRMMAIFAAKSYLAQEDTRDEGLRVLALAQALEQTAQEFSQAGNPKLAACCYERAGAIEEARNALISINDLSGALRICKEHQNLELEIDTLKRFKKYFKLGQKFISLKRYDEALTCFKRIDSDNPNYANSLELQGDIYCKQKKYSDATICYESLFWLNLPDDRVCRIAYKCGYAYELLDDFENAIRTYQKVYDIDPNFHDISKALNHVAEKLRRKSSMHQSARYTDLRIKDAVSHEQRISQNPSFDNRQASNQPPSRVSATGRKRVSTVMLGNAEVPAVGSDRYKVIEEVAHGGMGIVYKATDNILMRTVALKVLSQKLKDNQVALEYFMREARASAQLQHINIITVFDIGCLNDGNIYMAMEYVEGKNLKQLIQQIGPFPTKFLLHVAIHACKGLQYAHDHGIIHRDVKSSNMMLTKNDKTLKILDLGLAKILTEHEKGSTQAIGTPYYMSPEQVLGNEIDARSDIYSLGVTLFELATGVLPFVKGDLPYKHVHEAPPAPSMFNTQIHPQIEAIILKMMQKHPEDRYASCNELISALKRVDYKSHDA